MINPYQAPSPETVETSLHDKAGMPISWGVTAALTKTAFGFAGAIVGGLVTMALSSSNGGENPDSFTKMWLLLNICVGFVAGLSLASLIVSTLTASGKKDESG